VSCEYSKNKFMFISLIRQQARKVRCEKSEFVSASPFARFRIGFYVNAFAVFLLSGLLCLTQNGCENKPTSVPPRSIGLNGPTSKDIDGLVLAAVFDEVLRILDKELAFLSSGSTPSSVYVREQGSTFDAGQLDIVSEQDVSTWTEVYKLSPGAIPFASSALKQREGNELSKLLANDRRIKLVVEKNWSDENSISGPIDWGLPGYSEDGKVALVLLTFSYGSHHSTFSFILVLDGLGKWVVATHKLRNVF